MCVCVLCVLVRITQFSMNNHVHFCDLTKQLHSTDTVVGIFFSSAYRQNRMVYEHCHFFGFGKKEYDLTDTCGPGTAFQDGVCVVKTTPTSSVGDGHCLGTPTFSSHAWALHYGKRGPLLSLDSTDYADAVTQAATACKKNDPLNTHVSVWTDAGFRCYKQSTCDLTNHPASRVKTQTFRIK